MFKNAFQRIEGDEAQAILDQVNPKLDVEPYQGDGIAILAQNLPFYAGYQFLEISDHAAHPVRTHYVIYSAGDITLMDWTNEPIYTLNQKVPVTLTEETIPLYIQFFFTYVRGRHGRFLIVESIDDIAWREDPPPPVRKSVGSMITPITKVNVESDGTYIMKANMMFKDSLFRASVHVKTDGTVSLSEEELIIEDMPVLDDVLGL